ncbi:type II toxin-antitoxin system HicB family antitoxin [Zoogloea sp. LCSB751]|uniref:type II toxin-antitoxin system HicB family antitoxin n=1 Tax=Zoogloea sp. LCSB751 TaxID=1965277 RepID=UPI001C1FCA68|nr:type II toxin-antitoxin system HicB family antitoxin [Zoogloea sp. LCSB751]
MAELPADPEASRPEAMEILAMRYPIAIEPGDDTHAWGVVVPDLPGCFSAGDTLDEAIEHAPEAIELYIEGLLDDGEAVPPAQPISAHQGKPAFAGWIWALVEINPAMLDDQMNG